jgi:hypothetical protein
LAAERELRQLRLCDATRRNVALKSLLSPSNFTILGTFIPGNRRGDRRAARHRDEAHLLGPGGRLSG